MARIWRSIGNTLSIHHRATYTHAANALTGSVADAFKEREALKELLGHTPLEVLAGAILGGAKVSDKIEVIAGVFFTPIDTLVIFFVVPAFFAAAPATRSCASMSLRLRTAACARYAARDGRLASIAGGADEVMLGIICKLEGTLPKGGH